MFFENFEFLIVERSRACSTDVRFLAVLENTLVDTPRRYLSSERCPDQYENVNKDAAAPLSQINFPDGFLNSLIQRRAIELVPELILQAW